MLGLISINGENKPKALNLERKNTAKSFEDKNPRYARSFDSFVPSNWNPYYRAPMHTFWAAPYSHNQEKILTPHKVAHHPVIPHHPPKHYHRGPVYADHWYGQHYGTEHFLISYFFLSLQMKMNNKNVNFSFDISHRTSSMNLIQFELFFLYYRWTNSCSATKSSVNI